MSLCVCVRIYCTMCTIQFIHGQCSQHVTGEGMKQCETSPDQTRQDQKRLARNDNGRTNEQIDLMANPMLCQD